MGIFHKNLDDAETALRRGDKSEFAQIMSEHSSTIRLIHQLLQRIWPIISKCERNFPTPGYDVREFYGKNPLDKNLRLLAEMRSYRSEIEVLVDIIEEKSKKLK